MLKADKISQYFQSNRDDFSIVTNNGSCMIRGLFCLIPLFLISTFLRGEIKHRIFIRLSFYL